MLEPVIPGEKLRTKDQSSDHIRPIDGAVGLPVEVDSGARCYNNGGDLGMIHPSGERSDCVRCCLAEVKLRINKGDVKNCEKTGGQNGKFSLRKCIGVNLFPGGHCFEQDPGWARWRFIYARALQFLSFSGRRLAFLDALKMAATGFNTSNVVGIGVLHLLVLCDRWTRACLLPHR
ncbi:hypothetical protein J6590_044003 [Homalodisca vitripennis]|nr:hypothetical protein J6590_044003 [Homalodisca vitripennis]